MISYNKVILIGNLTRDPEVRYLPNGTAVASLAMAVNHRYKQGDETKDEVSYIDIVAFGKTAENSGLYLHKGDGILVDGRLKQRRWDDKETGQKRSKIEVHAIMINYMPKGNRGGGQSQGDGVPPDAHGSSPDVGEGDEIPF